jgi:hypothetical protein
MEGYRPEKRRVKKCPKKFDRASLTNKGAFTNSVYKFMPF